MPIDTATDLIDALRASRLFGPDKFPAVLAALAPVRDNLQAALKRVVANGWLTIYQLRKVVHGRAADLFVGPYLVTDKIGEGGMGRVYRARHRRVGREVALKVVRPNLLANPVIKARYQREVEAAGTLRHPNIVRVEDAGEAGGKCYLAMEFVDGLDLAHLVEAHRPLEVAEACEYARQAALGLQHAHECGFVHRDIKPSNVVVAGERHVPQATEPADVKILDMGLIRCTWLEESPVGIDVTRAGSVVGTPDYMAPEQARNPHAVDHRADLYSLGCTLYFLLTGQPPFPRGTAIEKVLAHQGEAPPPVQALRPDVPSSVAAVVARLMAKHPDDRYLTASFAALALAPLATYPWGAKPVPIRVWGRQADPAAETPQFTSKHTTPPANPHPRPRGAASPAPPPITPPPSPAPRGKPRPARSASALQAVMAAQPLSLAEQPSCPMSQPSRLVLPEPESSRTRWVAVGLAALAAALGAAVLALGTG